MEKLGITCPPDRVLLLSPSWIETPLLVYLDTAMYIVPYCKRLEKWFEGQIHLGYAFTETFA
jgi:hypothetical protein